jgi:hypothetical protein
MPRRRSSLEHMRSRRMRKSTSDLQCGRGIIDKEQVIHEDSRCKTPLWRLYFAFWEHVIPTTKLCTGRIPTPPTDLIVNQSRQAQALHLLHDSEIGAVRGVYQQVAIYH